MIVRVLSILSAGILLTFACAYYLTYEPAPRIRIRWRAGLEPARRTALERRFLLVNPNPFEDRFAYDLLDTTRDNIAAIVDERDIQDTDNIDRDHAAIPPQIPYGDSWMWIGNRLPVLRVPGVVTGIVAASAVTLALSVAVLLTRRRAKRTAEARTS
jgi:hypothetical protein